MNLQKLFSRLYLLFAVVSVVYYIICVIFAWAGVSWLWIWLVLAAFCLLRHGMLQLEIKGKVHFPYFVRMIYRVIVIAMVALFALVENSIIRDINDEFEPGLDYIVVLGAAVRNGEPTTPLILRIETACDYLNRNEKTWVIASGGKGPAENISEAECISNELERRGIKPYRIITENTSSSTEENLANSFRIIGYPNVRVGIVTNSFHVHRALMISNQLGYRNVCGISAPTLMPLGIHYFVREFFAVCELWMKHFL